MTTTYDAWLTETPEDADDRIAARDEARSNRAGPQPYSVSDYDRWVPSTGADGVTRYSRVNMLDYIQE